MKKNRNRRKEPRSIRCGLVPLRKRRKRLHKKLAKRGFSCTRLLIVWSTPTPGYGVRGTEFDHVPSS